ncbi:MAG: Flp pilus assembly protein CpaB [Lachnospiraceae bacterium]|nr:Flp pilus assembly protein CpaB [Lachnospiraceae bacterium]
MKKFKIIALIAAVVVGIGLYYFLSFLSNSENEVQRTAVIVAAVNIPENTTIEASMLTTKEIPTEAVLSNAVKNMDEAVGMLVNSGVLAGEQLVFDRLVKVGEQEATDSLAYLVKPGMRAMTISVEQTTGIAGMIKPGNSIDLIYRYTREADSAGEEAEEKEEGEETIPVSKILLQNVYVLAVDKNMSKASTPQSQESYKTITLQVSPEDAVVLNFAVNSGIVSAVLRSPIDTDSIQVPEITSKEIDNY